MEAKFAWKDKTGGIHPSMICVFDIGDDTIDPKNMPQLAPPRPIWNFNDVLTSRYQFDRRKLPKFPGLRPQWYLRVIESPATSDDPWYATIIGYVKDN